MPDQSDRRPLLVLGSGAPGAGKSTLARRLADYMRLVHIDRDAFFWSLSYTQGEQIDRRSVGIPAYYESLVYLLKKGVSLVTDGTLYRGASEQDIAAYLAPVARIVNVHCRATNEKERFRSREIERAGGVAPEWLDGHMPRLDAIYADTCDPLDLGCMCIEVDSTDQYSPSVAAVAERIGRNAHRQ